MKKIVVIYQLLFCTVFFAQTKSLPQNKDNAATWFPYYDFNLAQFKTPQLSYGPMARWWWPGNNVTKEELKREINLFADNGFAGVEVQPLNLAIPKDKDQDKVLSWDTEAYYENLRTVMEEAKKRNLIVDVTNGSGWPPGGAFLDPEDGFLSLEWSAVTISGGKKVVVALPLLAGKSSVSPRLQAVVGSRISSKESGKEDNLPLDASSTIILTSFIQNNTLNYSFPEGNWKVIAFWAVPSGEKTNIAATPIQGPVVDHFDSVKVLKLYDHLFGRRTGLQPYFGNPMRAIFNDSYEFKANRHYSLDFIDHFKRKRGYDITPWLPANMQKGYNYVAFMRPNVKPDFSFSEQDWRLQYDYDITLSELLGEHFFKTSKIWMEKQGLLHRTQAYGLKMDMMAMAGLASIPETESMLGNEADIKVMTSGALLYNRPLITAESTVFSGMAYTTTPQKVKIAVDKLFAAGVNQIIYHGIPYRYTPESVGPEGWYPFSSPLLGSVSFSSNLGEGNIFWKDQKDLNEYISRVQYALCSGKRRADVLLYYPYLDVEGMPENEEEILTKGNIVGVDAPLPAPRAKELPNPEKVEWAKKVYPLINQLEARGITWAWVNDASLQEAKLENDNKINIRGNLFSALILANDSIIQLKTSENIKSLANKGMHLLATGVLPTKQSSFLNWRVNDKKTKQNIAAALKSKNSRYLQGTNELNEWMQHLPQTIKFNDSYSFTRQVEREMNDGSTIRFIWNKTEQWQKITVTLDKKYTSSHWLNPDAGTISKNDGLTANYQIPPYGAVILLASTHGFSDESFVSYSSKVVYPDKEILAIRKWDVTAGDILLKDSTLFDWKSDDALKFSGAKGIYSSSFEWNQKTVGKPVFLDLGKVYFTAEVFINGKFAGKRIYAPYLLDISSFLQSGTNSIEVHVTPTQLNGFIGLSKKGDKRYSQFKGKENKIISAGLIGPVVIKIKSSED